jgi:hypothetical protein
LAEPGESFMDFLVHLALGNPPMGKTDQQIAYPRTRLAFSNLEQEDTKARTWNVFLMGFGIVLATSTSGGLSQGSGQSEGPGR